MRPSGGALPPLAALLLGACAIIPESDAPRAEQRPPRSRPSPPPPELAPSPAPPAERPPAAPSAQDATPPWEQPLPPADRNYDFQPTPLLHLTVPATPGENALGEGVRRGPPVAELIEDVAHAERALHAFLISCPSAINQEDRSGLTGAHDWVEPCRAARRWPARDAREFFARHFVAVEVGDGAAFATGYYEPEIAASLTRRAGYDEPIYGLPSDLIERPQPRAMDRSSLPAVGRMEDDELVAYHDRAAIEAGALQGRGLEIAWARDPVDVFFLQVQGSGVLRLPDGSIARVGYAGNNGFGYVSIGALLRDRGALAPGETTAQGIAAWLRAHTEEGRAVMNANPRYVFMRLTGAPAPGGSLGRSVTPRATVAVDWSFVPPGAPVILDVDQDVADGVWIAQDTGGAIRGANRFDTFWGTGAEAFRIAGGMAGRGRAWVLVPRAAAARLFGS